jgi:hypothetical protein
MKSSGASADLQARALKMAGQKREPLIGGQDEFPIYTLVRARLQERAILLARVLFGPFIQHLPCKLASCK